MSFSSTSTVSSALFAHVFRSLALIDTNCASSTILAMGDLPYLMPSAAANRNEGVVPLIVQANRNHVSAITDPDVRRICPPAAVAASNVSCVVGDANVLSASDSTRALIVGVDVPATDRTCSEAYSRLPTATAPRSTPEPEPDVVRAVPGGCANWPRTSGQDDLAPPFHGATSPTSPRNSYELRS